MACRDCGKKTMMIMSIISLVLGVLCLILSIVMIATISSDFIGKSQTGDYDYCDGPDSSKSRGQQSHAKSGFPYMGLNGDGKSRAKEEEENTRAYIPGTCFSFTKAERDEQIKTHGKSTFDIFCECKNARYGASALLTITSLLQIAGAVVLLLLVLSMIMKEKPLKFKWLIFLVLHVVVLVLLLITSIISQVYHMSEDEEEAYARLTASALTGGMKRQNQNTSPPAKLNFHPNVQGKMFAAFLGLDFCFCIACIIVAALTFCKCGKCLLDENGPNANQNPNQSGFASQKPSTEATKPKSRASTPAPEKSSKTNASASTRQSKRDVAGDKKK